MKLKRTEVEIPEEDPFKYDELEREAGAYALTEFVLSSDEPMVVCIDAPWGQGKTTFLKMWRQSLINKGVPTVYFNAWESDFSDDAFISLIGEVSSNIVQLSKTGDESKAREHLETAKTIGLALVKRAVPVLVKVGTAGALDLDKVTEVALAGLAESLTKEKIEEYESAKSSREVFKETLSLFAAQLSNPEEPKPLVIIIDELDRCRPKYAIEILEKTKHLFNVENIVFVLGADKEQLGSAMKSVYGQGLKEDRYLQRFMDFVYVLPQAKKGKYVEALFKSFGFEEYFSGDDSANSKHAEEHALLMFSNLFHLYELTLREQDQCCSLLSACIRTASSRDQIHPLFLCFLIVLKTKDQDRYKELIETDDLLGFVNRYKNSSVAAPVFEERYGMVLEAHIVSSGPMRYCKETVLPEYEAIVNSEEASEEDKKRYTRIPEILYGHEFEGAFDSLMPLLQKLEIAGNFTR